MGSSSWLFTPTEKTTIYGGFFTDFNEMIELCPRVTIDLNVFVGVWGNAIEVRVAQEQDGSIAFKNPILDFSGLSGAVVNGS